MLNAPITYQAVVLYPTTVLSGISLVGGFWAIVGDVAWINYYINWFIFARFSRHTKISD